MASIVVARGVPDVLFSSVGFPPVIARRATSGSVSLPQCGVSFLDPQTESWDVSIFDRVVLRGDGFFEAMSVVDGKVPVSLDLHLERLATSAAMLDMPQPDAEAFKEACKEVILRYDGGHDDPMLRIIVSRGLDSSTGVGREFGAGIPSVWFYLDGVGARHSTKSATLVSLSSGHDSEAAASAPWLLLGAKSLSYASNMAAEREARRRSADDAVFVTTDGFVLESPHASVVARIGDTFITPDPSIGVLHGTTQQEFFAYLRRNGFATEYREVTLRELRHADEIYQTRGGWVSPVSKLDGYDIAVNEEMVGSANHAIHYERAQQEAELINDDYGI